MNPMIPLTTRQHSLASNTPSLKPNSILPVALSYLPNDFSQHFGSQKMNNNYSSYQHVHKRVMVLGIMFFIITILLSACGAVEQDVTLIKNEKWKAETRLTIDKQSLALISPADIEQRLDAAKNELASLDVSYKWKKSVNDDGSLTYIIDTSGTGYSLLNEAIFDGNASINTIDDDGTTEFNYTVFGDFSDYALVLHVGEVLETNGLVTEKGEISWHGMGMQMHAIVKPKSGTNIKWVLLGSGALLVGLVAFFSFSRTRPSSTPRHSPHSSSQFSSSSTGMTSLNYCHRCGGKLDPNGVFCPHCGAPQT